MSLHEIWEHEKTGTRSRLSTRELSRSPAGSDSAKRFARKPRIAPPTAKATLCTCKPNFRTMAAGDGARCPAGRAFRIRRPHHRHLLPSVLSQPQAAARFGGVLCRSRTAERAGYRACLRCKPTEISGPGAICQRARQLLDNAEGVVTLAQLSQQVGLSPFHLQRLFKRATGLSPREYQSARRMQQVKTELRKGEDVTTALYEAGFSSPSRLYENSTQQLGMTPGAYRRGGAGQPSHTPSCRLPWDAC